MNRQALLCGSVIISLLGSCSPRLQPSTTHFESSGSPDYNRFEAWAAHPSKEDFSDNVPAPLKPGYRKDSSVDVFFIHPTTLTSKSDTSWNANLADEALNRITDEKPIQYQASVFNEFNVYAPRYRQAHYRSYFTNDTTEARKAFDLAYRDVRQAFMIFIEQHPDRPFILASHSQGSTHAIRLLKEFIDGKPLQKRLVVAYILGMRVPDEFETIGLCSDSAATGCLVAWRTYREGYEPAFVGRETGRPMVTNPLTWRTDTEEAAPAQLNQGAVLTNFDRLFPNAADAQIHGRVLWVSSLHFPGSFLVRRKNLHVGDVNLFYNNIRQNARVRVAAFKAALRSSS